MKKSLPYVLSIACAMLAFVPLTTHSQTAPLEHFEGRFSFAGGTPEVRSMEQSINRVVDRFNIFVREIARGEIHRAIDPEPRVELAIEGDRAMTLRLGEWGPVQVPLDGTPRTVRGPDGNPTRVSAQFEQGRLIERQVTGQGSRVNVFTLGPDGQTLQMHVRISSEQLPDHIRYRLSYRRAR